MKFSRTVGLSLFLMLTMQFCSLCSADEEFHASVEKFPYSVPDMTVVGTPKWYSIKPQDTMLDIARRNGLGFNSVDLLFPKMDAWVPPNGKRVFLPTFWVLPPTQHYQLVINIPELRLYFFDQQHFNSSDLSDRDRR